MSEFSIKRGDTMPFIQSQLTDGSGQAIDLTGADVRFHMTDMDGVVITDAAGQIDDAENGLVSYAWAQADTETEGMFRAEWEVDFTGDGSMTETFPNTTYITILITDDLA